MHFLVNPRIQFLLDVTSLLGRLSYSISQGDTTAFLNLVKEVEKACAEAKKRLTIRIVDPFYDADDDDL